MAQDLNIKKRTRGAIFAVTRWIGSVESIIVHTVFFIVSFGAVWAGVLNFDRMLLILTTAVSLEAIYLAIFIQLTVNQTTESLEEVEQDIDEIQEDIDELQEDVEEMTEEEKEDERRKEEQKVTLQEIRQGLKKLAEDLERLQKNS
jgi:peptidoglycan hydrolase CwlO-like protein